MWWYDMQYTRRVQSTKILALTVILMLVTACGFHLRGYFNIPPQFRILRLLPCQPYDPFQRSLRQSLTLNGVCVVDDTSSAQGAILTVNDFAFSERVIAYSSDNQASRSTLQLTLSFFVTDCKGAILIPESTILVSRDITILPNAVLGTNYERDAVKVELQNDAITQILRQISAG